VRAQCAGGAEKRSTHSGRPIILRAATLRTATLRLPDRARFVRVPGATRLALESGGHPIAADCGVRDMLSSLMVDGADRPLESDNGLIDVSNPMSASCRSPTARSNKPAGSAYAYTVAADERTVSRHHKRAAFGRERTGRFRAIEVPTRTFARPSRRGE
jgi:hypothetical protein